MLNNIYGYFIFINMKKNFFKKKKKKRKKLKYKNKKKKY